jgi:hypothetical protein
VGWLATKTQMTQGSLDWIGIRKAILARYAMEITFSVNQQIKGNAFPKQCRSPTEINSQECSRLSAEHMDSHSSSFHGIRNHRDSAAHNDLDIRAHRGMV